MPFQPVNDSNTEATRNSRSVWHGAQDRTLRRLNRRERKERSDTGQKGRGLALAAGRVLRPGQLAHLELIGAEIDEQTMFETGGLQVTKNLSHLLVGQSFGSF